MSLLCDYSTREHRRLYFHTVKRLSRCLECYVKNKLLADELVFKTSHYLYLNWLQKSSVFFFPSYFFRIEKQVEGLIPSRNSCWWEMNWNKTSTHTNTEQTKQLLIGWRVSVYICTIKITVLTKYKINNINNTKINAFWVAGLVTTGDSFKICCFCLRRQLQTFVSLNYISHEALGVSVPFHIVSFFLYIYFFISSFSLIYLYFFSFLHLGFPPTPPFLNWPTTVQLCSLLQPPAANQEQVSEWATDSGEVKGERSQRQRSAAAVPR